MPQKFIKRVQEMRFVRRGVRLVDSKLKHLIPDQEPSYVQPMNIYNQGVAFQIIKNLAEHHNRDANELNYIFLLNEGEESTSSQFMVGWLGLPDLTNRSRILYSVSHGGEYCIDPNTGYGIYDINTYSYMKNRYETNLRKIPMYFCYTAIDWMDPKQLIITSLVRDLYKMHKQHTLVEKPDVLHLKDTKDFLVFPI